MEITTPVCDFVEKYRESRFSRFHMPGHKGVSFLGCEPWDITEICGADDLARGEGIILESENNASALFESRHTFYATGGSSQCLRAMLYLAWLYRADGQGRRVLAARNVHRSFLSACAFLDLSVTWLRPSEPGSLCSCPVAPEQLRQELSELFSAEESEKERPFAVFVTSPDYLGGMQDIGALAQVCHSFGLPLLVDNAHGAYLKFLPSSLHPLDLGADMCCDSAHKTLPALTGCAYLHIGRGSLYPYGEQARSALSLFGSTSPSYLLLQSLDRCNAYLAGGYPEKLAAAVRRREDLCRRAEAGRKTDPCLRPDTDPLRLVFQTAGTDAGRESGSGGYGLAAHFRRFHIECEYADRDSVVFMFTPENTQEDWDRLLAAAGSLPEGQAASEGVRVPPYPAPVQRMSIREALLSRSVTLPLGQTLGRICAAPAVSCPPAIPIAVSGEQITEEVLALCRYYGVTELAVVAEP